MNNRKTTLFFVCLIFCAVVCPVHAEPGHASDSLRLDNTSIQMPWQEFQKLSRQKKDTVYVRPDAMAPAPILFDNAEIQVSLADSSAECRLTAEYRVLDNTPWLSALFLGESGEFRFTDIDCYAGDYLTMSDSGYCLLARGNGPKSTRKIRATWFVNAQREEGLRRIGFPLPSVSRGIIRIHASAGFSGILVEQAVLLAKKPAAGGMVYSYSLPNRGSEAVILFAPPVTSAEPDSGEVSVKAKSSEEREPKVTCLYETVLFISEESVFSISAVQVDVAHAPISAFTVQLPQNFSLLQIEGSGIQKWKALDKNRVAVHLTFELEGRYTFFIAGETTADSVISFPGISVDKTMRQTGRFAVAVSGTGEAHFISMNNCVGIPRNLFIAEMTGGTKKTLDKYNKDARDILIAGAFYRQPFEAQFKVLRHTPVPVADALADSGVVITAVTKDWKAITQASFWIRQRNRQFISLSLPDTCDLWSVSINGKDIAPFMDNSGSFKVSLQRYVETREDIKPLLLRFTFFQNLKRAETAKLLVFKAPVPDIPVTTLSWTLFYPDDWRAGTVSGDFTTTRSTALGKKSIRLSKELKSEQYKNIVESNKYQQDAGRRIDIPMVETSANYVYGRRLLVVDESPKLSVAFVSRGYYYGMRFIILLVIISVLGAAGYFGYRRIGNLQNH